MIFKEDGSPLTEDEYTQRLLAWTMILVKAAGGRLEVPKNLIDNSDERTLLTQEIDPETGALILKVS